MLLMLVVCCCLLFVGVVVVVYLLVVFVVLVVDVDLVGVMLCVVIYKGGWCVLLQVVGFVDMLYWIDWCELNNGVLYIEVFNVDVFDIGLGSEILVVFVVCQKVNVKFILCVCEDLNNQVMFVCKDMLICGIVDLKGKCVGYVCVMMLYYFLY